MKSEKTVAVAAAKAGMDEKTARKYLRLGKLPCDVKTEHGWRTREDAFADVWPEIKEKLETNSGLEAKTIFDYLQRSYPGKFCDGQLRTLQRRIKIWRVQEGPPKEVFFPQLHKAGELCQSDFTCMNSLGITICGAPFNHLVFHFVLTYSNWEAGSICFSESFESLSDGLQSALWKLGGVPRSHRTDRMSAAVPNNHKEKRRHFTRRYEALMRHYKLDAHKIQTAKPNENGDIEQRHYRFKKALDQALLLRSSRDFDNRKEYTTFLEKLFSQLNAGRWERLNEELKQLRRLPDTRYDSCKRFPLKVGPSSTIRIAHNVYSVDSRLIGETVRIRLYAEYLEVWYGQRCMEKIPRLRGEEKHHIQYRHIIDWLVRKPGAFANYRYHRDLFPSHCFRMAYDSLKRNNKEYLKILHLAAKESETKVDQALALLIHENRPVSFERVSELIHHNQEYAIKEAVEVDTVDIRIYDRLLVEGVA
ncbi:MAG: IS21 family transposase [Calditrichaceae bacterium]